MEHTHVRTFKTQTNPRRYCVRMMYKQPDIITGSTLCIAKIGGKLRPTNKVFLIKHFTILKLRTAGRYFSILVQGSKFATQFFGADLSSQLNCLSKKQFYGHLNALITPLFFFILSTLFYSAY